MFDEQKAKNELKSSLEQLYIKAVTDLTNPETVAEQSSLTLETARSHKMVRHRLYYSTVRHSSLCVKVVWHCLYDTAHSEAKPLWYSGAFMMHGNWWETAPHSVEHLFNCQSHPTQLTVQDLWDNPAEKWPLSVMVANHYGWHWLTVHFLSTVVLMPIQQGNDQHVNQNRP